MIEIKKMREDAGMTQKELAKKMHTKQQYISRIEQPGYLNITVPYLDRIASIFGKRVSIELAGKK